MNTPARLCTAENMAVLVSVLLLSAGSAAAQQTGRTAEIATMARVFAGQTQSTMTIQACQAVDVTVATSTPRVQVGTRPQFSVVVANRSNRSVRVLDVRSGRRNDLQDVYFELLIVEGQHVVDLPTYISDPGPIADTDYALLKPGERIEVRRLSYTRAAELLPPGEYAAFHPFLAAPRKAAHNALPLERSAFRSLELNRNSLAAVCAREHWAEN